MQDTSHTTCMHIDVNTYTHKERYAHTNTHILAHTETTQHKPQWNWQLKSWSSTVSTNRSGVADCRLSRPDSFRDHESVRCWTDLRPHRCCWALPCHCNPLLSHIPEWQARSGNPWPWCSTGCATWWRWQSVWCGLSLPGACWDLHPLRCVWGSLLRTSWAVRQGTGSTPGKHQIHTIYRTTSFTTFSGTEEQYQQLIQPFQLIFTFFKNSTDGWHSQCVITRWRKTHLISGI